MSLHSIAEFKDLPRVTIAASDRVYFKKYPYRIDVGKYPTSYDECINAFNLVEQQVRGAKRSGTSRHTFYLEDFDDLKRIVDSINHSTVYLFITGPTNDNHIEVLQNHNRDTQVIKKKLWWGQFDIRLCISFFARSDYKRADADKRNQTKLGQLASFVKENFDADDYQIQEDYLFQPMPWTYGQQNHDKMPQVIYLRSAGNEDIVGMLKLQFASDKSVIDSFERAVIIPK